MRICIVERGRNESEVLGAMLEAFYGVTPEFIDEEQLQNPAGRIALLKSGYDIVILPLALHNYVALKLGELTHQLGSTTRLLLRSGTRAPRDVLLTLFDGFMPVMTSSQELRDTIDSLPSLPPRRHQSATAIEGAIAGILATASCFNRSWAGPGSHASEPSIFEDYRESDIRSDVQRTYAERPPDRIDPTTGFYVPPVRVFISYSHEDDSLRQQLDQHLSLLKRQGKIDVWHDRRINAGAEWKGQINRELSEAQIILLLVSPAFLASDYCYDVELKVALFRHRDGEAAVIPIIVRPCDWKFAAFAKLQALPSDGQAVTTWASVDEAWRDVALGIRRHADLTKPEHLRGP